MAYPRCKAECRKILPLALQSAIDVYVNPACGFNTAPFQLPTCNINSFEQNFGLYSLGCEFEAFFFNLGPNQSNVVKVQQYNACDKNCLSACRYSPPDCPIP